MFPLVNRTLGQSTGKNLCQRPGLVTHGDLATLRQPLEVMSTAPMGMAPMEKRPEVEAIVAGCLMDLIVAYCSHSSLR